MAWISWNVFVESDEPLLSSSGFILRSTLSFATKASWSLNQTDSRALEVKSLTNAPHPREQINPFSKALHIWQMLSSHLSDPSFTLKHWNTHCYEHILSISLTLPPMINRHTKHRSHTPVIKFRTVVLECLFWFLSLLFTSLFWPLTVDILTSLQETSMSFLPLCGRSYVSPML